MSQFSKCKSLSLEILADRGEQLSRFIQEKGRTIRGGRSESEEERKALVNRGSISVAWW